GERLNVVPDYASAIITKDLSNEFNIFLKQHNLTGDFINHEDTFEVIVRGVGAHAMQLEKGVNAGVWLAKFLSKYDNNEHLNFLTNSSDDTSFKTKNLNGTDPEMRDLTVNVGLINIEKNKLVIKLNLRYPINWDQEGFYNQLTNLASNAGLS